MKDRVLFAIRHLSSGLAKYIPYTSISVLATTANCSGSRGRGVTTGIVVFAGPGLIRGSMPRSPATMPIFEIRYRPRDTPPKALIADLRRVARENEGLRLTVTLY